MNSSPEATPLYWKRKLAAYLHDSPDKVLDILDHERRARRIAGDIPDEEQARREADWAASAADRLPFPPSALTKTPLSRFVHPLGGTELALDPEAITVASAEETSQTTRPRIAEDDPRAAFIATWRFWRNWAASRNPDFALYPAETRLPDHTIWNHLAVTSAMQGCLGGEPWRPGNDSGVADHPSFLLFTIGPVQDLIAAARSTRDLWSGSYLLSYLVGHALRRIALDFGPDHVIFPNLCDQPIMDLLLRDDVWENVETASGEKLFPAFDYYSEDAKQRLLTPSLPNRFLALLPSRMTEHQTRGTDFASVEDYARFLARDLRRFLRDEIAGPVADAARNALHDQFLLDRFSRQLDGILEVHWQVLPWPAEFEAAESMARRLPADAGDYTPRSGLETTLHLAQHGADSRYLLRGKPKNIASAWSALYAAAEWMLSGTKGTRAFAGSGSSGSEPGRGNTKDSLTGREEGVLMVGESDAEDVSRKLEREVGKGHLIKPGEVLGAATLIKRLWPYTVLCRHHAFKPDDLKMPNTRSIAAHAPWRDDEGEDLESAPGEKYFAVLALDGDSMGKWISGAKTPPLSALLSQECRQAYAQQGAELSRKRPLSPAWHLQFSEALGNFAQHAVRRIVEAHDGRLIYAGGDDVLAMLPADQAVACAQRLRQAFQGDPKVNELKGQLPDGQVGPLFQIETPGFLRLSPNATRRHGTGGKLLDDPVNFPVLVPGPGTDCSVGIAMAHFKSPLQDVVKAAQAAERRAKRDIEAGGLGRGAVAVSLFKRSGETLEWGARWDDGGLELYAALLGALERETLSSRFPYRLCELLTPLISPKQSNSATLTGAPRDVPSFPAAEFVRQEFERCLHQHSGPRSGHETTPLLALVREHLDHLSDRGPSDLLQSLVGLLSAAAFAHRSR